MSLAVSGATRVAGVMGRPIRHSLSPMLHNAWLEASGIDGIYIPIEVADEGFGALISAFRATSLSGLNVTLPFKQQALMAADTVSERAQRAQAANLLVFNEGRILADNTDGLGLMAAFAEQAPGFDPRGGPVAILGAGGAALGAAAMLVEVGCPQVRIVNRTAARAQRLAADLGAAAFSLADAEKAFEGVIAVINATSAGVADKDVLRLPLAATPAGCVVMDMVYQPLVTPILAQARALGRRTVDGLAMLIGQAVPSFEAFFGQTPPTDIDVRALALAALEARK